MPLKHTARRFLTADWRNLAMLNYEVDPAALASRVPRGCELDFWQGSTFVSIVGFQFLRTRVLGLPVPFHRSFEEVNLRFYVRRKTDGGFRRGVVFVKEIVPRRAIAWVARRVYDENYVALPMRHAVCAAGESGTGHASYEWYRAGSWEGLRAEFSGPPALRPDDAEETFITEHYFGYATRSDGSTLEYRVEHPRWRVWRASRAVLECDAAAIYGPEFAAALASPPSTAFVADGSPVIVHRACEV